jgi:predicted nuclease of predicted toxin-antitoxin system
MLRVLLDENMPRKLTRLFDAGDVEVQTIAQRGWRGKQNGELLRAAQNEFDVFVTVDRGIPHQQNLSRFNIGIILIEARSNRFADLAPLMEHVNETAKQVMKGELITVSV